MGSGGTEYGPESPNTEEKPAPGERRPSMLKFALIVVMAMFWSHMCVQKAQYRQNFLNEFGYPSNEEGHPLVIQSRLQALCYEYVAATARAEATRQTVMPGGILPGSEAEREQFIIDAIELLAEQKADFARTHFIFSRRLAESVDPIPVIIGCRELISIEEEP